MIELPITLVIASVLFVLVYRHYNKEDKTTTLTVAEKKWVEKNKDKTYDFEVINDYPLYGMNGDGVIFNFLDDFQKNVGIEFNRIPYLKTSTPKTESYRIEILDNDATLSKNNLFLFNDNYIIVGKNYERILHRLCHECYRLTSSAGCKRWPETGTAPSAVFHDRAE